MGRWIDVSLSGGSNGGGRITGCVVCVIYIYIQTINLHSFSIINAFLYSLFLTYIWFEYQESPLVGLIVDTVINVNLSGVVKKKV